MLRRAVEFPVSKKILRLARWLGSYKRLLVALGWRRNCNVSDHQSHWTYLVRMQLRHPRNLDEFINRITFRYKRCTHVYSTYKLLILMGFDTSSVWANYMPYTSQAIAVLYLEDENLLRLMVAQSHNENGINNLINTFGGCAINACNWAFKIYLDSGDTGSLFPLHFAARYLEPEVVELLLDRVDVNERDEENLTPLYIAVEMRRFKVVEMIKAAGGVVYQRRDRRRW